jgi:hypothetical protein
MWAVWLSSTATTWVMWPGVIDGDDVGNVAVIVVDDDVGDVARRHRRCG